MVAIFFDSFKVSLFLPEIKESIKQKRKGKNINRHTGCRCGGTSFKFDTMLLVMDQRLVVQRMPVSDT